MFTSYDDLKVNLPEFPTEEEYGPLLRPKSPKDSPFYSTKFWSRVKILHDDALVVSFYKQLAGHAVPWHADDATSSFNYMIEGGTAPVVFENGEQHHYKCAFFDVTKKHMVPAASEDRFFLKISLKGWRTFEVIKPRLDNAFKDIKEIDYEDLLKVLR